MVPVPERDQPPFYQLVARMLSSQQTIVLPSGVVVIETRYSRESSAGLDPALFVSVEAIVMQVTSPHAGRCQIFDLD